MKQFIWSLRSKKKYPDYLKDSSKTIELIAEQRALHFSLDVVQKMSPGVQSIVIPKFLERLGAVDAQLERVK